MLGSEGISSIRLSRRDFITLGVRAAAAILPLVAVSGCASVFQKEVHNNDRLPNNLFSDAIQKAGLVPTVLKNRTLAQMQQAGVSYISRLRDYLHQNPDLSGPNLYTLNINTPDNLPVAFPRDADSLTVLDTLLNDLNRGSLRFTIATDNQIGLMETGSTYNWVDG